MSDANELQEKTLFKDTSDSQDRIPYYLGQIVYFDKVEKAGEDSVVMARIALAIEARACPYPVSFSDLLFLSWENYHATLTFLTLAANVHITWDGRRKKTLKSLANS